MIHILRKLADHLEGLRTQDIDEAVAAAVNAANAAKGMPLVRVPEPAVESLFGEMPALPALPAQANKNAGRWIPPGEPVIAKGIRIADGMFYFGNSLHAISGYTVEPALVNPKLSANLDDEGHREPSYFYNLEYRSLSPALRLRYLEWLAGSRENGSAHHARFATLYFYGLERRLAGPFVSGRRKIDATVEPPLRPGEDQILRREVRRIATAFPDALIARSAQALLAFLDLKDLLTPGNESTLPDPVAIAVLPKISQREPPILSLGLARLALAKTPLPSDWAWAWFAHDIEGNRRTAAVRCPEEARRLFGVRFQSENTKPILLWTVKPTVTMAYELLNNGSYLRATLSGVGGPVHQVSRAPLKAIRETANACLDALDDYSRRVGRDPDSRDTLPAIALLPAPLFAEHPETIRFHAWLDARLTADTTDGAGTAVQATTISVADLLARWQGTAMTTPLSRSDTMTLLDATDRLGFALEPDLRFGGGPLAVGKEGTAIAALARCADTSEAGPINGVLHAVGLPLLVRAARAAGTATLDALTPLALRLPHQRSEYRARVAARLAFLIANEKESARLPKPKDPLLAGLTPDERTQTADILAMVAGSSGTLRPTAIAELVRLFALLGLPDTDLFMRLHAQASGGPARRTGPSTLDEPLATVDRLTIDLALVRQKQAESAQISTLLADIFTDDEPVAATTQTPAPATVAAPSPGSLDARHAALLRSLLAKEMWTKAEVAALARAEALLPNAAVETLNEAAFARFDEPLLEGDDPVFVSTDLARQLI